jgi:spoIIIJ-associated protein
MMDMIECKGKTVDEAVFSGLLKMDLSIDEVNIEILDEGGGLFKSARVRMTKKKDSDMPGIVALASEKKEQDAYRKEERRAPRYEERPRRNTQPGRGSHRPRNFEPRYERRPEEPIVPKDPQNDAEKFLYGMFEKMGINVALESEKEDDLLKIDMSGRSMGMLIGRRGETLDALQYLTSLVLNNGREDYTKVMLDTENYRKKREEALRRLAVRLAEKVMRSGRKVVLEPMNPYERRILHATLQDYDGITTYSEGEDPFRSVVVALKREKVKSEEK